MATDETQVGGRTRRAVGGAGIAGAAVLFAPAAADAATFTVTNTNDAGPGSLRQAIDDANGNAGADTVDLGGVTGTIALTSGLPTISEALTVDGPGAGTLTVDGPGTSVVFNVSGGPTTIDGLTITDGQGGVVVTSGATLTITDSVITGNSTPGRGGGISAQNSSSVTLEGVTVSDNQATGYGGGVYFRGSGSLTVEDSAITGNTSTDSGGGIGLYDLSGSVVVRDSTISGNTSNRYGGGLYNEDAYSGSSITVERSTISGNQAARGGGVTLAEDLQGPVVFVDSTISGNIATGDAGGVRIFANYAGGINAATSLVFGNSTIADNTAGGEAGGIDRAFQNTPFTLDSTVVADNTSPGTAQDLRTDNGGDVNAEHSLVEAPGGTTITETTPGTVITGQDPQLGALADNGGSTETQQPALTSPLIDAGIANGLTVDQRGSARTVDQPDVADGPNSDGTDIGAVERAVPGAPPPTPPPPGPADADRPRVRITTPSDEFTRLPNDREFRVSARATDASGISELRILLGDRQLCAGPTSTLTCRVRLNDGDVGEDELTAIATDTTGRTGRAVRRVHVSRFRRSWVSLRARRVSDLGADTAVLRYSGEVRLPFGVTKANGCVGTVVARVRAANRTVGRVRLELEAEERRGVSRFRCTFRGRQEIALSDLPARARRLRVQVLAPSNDVLLRRSSRIKRIRVR